MIIEFSIQNFGSIKDEQVLSFEATDSDYLEDYYIIKTTSGLRLLKLCLIYGANASGKTTILKALDFLREMVLEPAGKKTEDLHFEPFRFDPHTPQQDSVMTIDFIQNDVRYNYNIVFNKKAVVKEELNHFKPNKANIFRRTTNLEKRLTEISFSNSVEKDKIFENNLEANTLWNNTVLGGFIKTNIEFPDLKEVTDWFSSYLRPLIHDRTEIDDYVTTLIEANQINKHSVIEILKKADLNISDISIEEAKEAAQTWLKLLESSYTSKETIQKILSSRLKKIEFEHTVNNKKYYLPLKMESQGTQRYYGFAGLLNLLIKNSTAIPIDEIDASLHPDLCMHFMLSFLANAKKSQILATIHNREVLSNRDVFRNDAIWFTEMNKSSATKLYSLADFDSDFIKDTSDVYMPYKTGKLGGVPDLGDYFINVEDEQN